jgi:hypothetical protein
VVISPDGEIRITLPGNGSFGDVNDIASLHGPYPWVFQVWTHHSDAPPTGRSGVAEHVPEPEGQPALDAAYHQMMGFPSLGLTLRRYQVALSTASQLYVGVLVSTAPEGEIGVAFPGASEGAVKAIPSLQGP